MRIGSPPSAPSPPFPWSSPSCRWYIERPPATLPRPRALPLVEAGSAVQRPTVPLRKGVAGMKRAAAQSTGRGRWALIPAALIALTGCRTGAAGLPAASQAPIAAARRLTARVTLQPAKPSTAVALSFINPATGWVAVSVPGGPGPVTVLKTVDDGRKWTVAGRLPVRPEGFQFLNPRDGFAATAGPLYVTTDGGRRWSARSPWPVDAHCFVTPSTGVAVADGKVVRTGNGGRTWTPVLAAAGVRFQGMSAPTAREFFVIGSGPAGPVLYRSSDGGTSWSPLFTSVSSPALQSACQADLAQSPYPVPAAHPPAFWEGQMVTFTGPDTGWIRLFDGSYLSTLYARTANEGRTWGYAWGQLRLRHGLQCRRRRAPGGRFRGRIRCLAGCRAGHPTLSRRRPELQQHAPALRGGHPGGGAGRRLRQRPPGLSGHGGRHLRDSERRRRLAAPLAPEPGAAGDGQPPRRRPQVRGARQSAHRALDHPRRRAGLDASLPLFLPHHGHGSAGGRGRLGLCRGALLITADGGRSWHRVPARFPSLKPFVPSPVVVMASSRYGWDLVPRFTAGPRPSYAPTLYVTTDGGRS
ncbi:protein of unknown function [Candidatus Hydrogenisulfobacillus filiaventi]|uniref:Photosynthesis system II assembly factor Ycf48/Hcf136-like domain-containing protein n=1 Tax=Candidatus Hydrogenisulfobacillus filiaventi TaxID=2707344 RepID=A0A6F8ZFZ9_9FIRM|nr:protein of unknown function [Candidatus Hydrogenisulfobacillus filiaventi]